ncbi:Transcription factor E2F1 [Dissostichus eleginoides]|uniref:Transcription factor E2F1 n=1 Tax=Dissostichus eleginoides TaxID=100907 RepID=A0AAD9FDI1_DISEL|nr:Transcription factor E2F1 [Dissostichus eleginoides]
MSEPICFLSSVPRTTTEKSRYDTSLNLTTKRFLNLLSQSADGVVDLNWASQVLDVQKRRIYDITNVLEGIQLISKKSKNNIQWLGNRVDAAVVSRQKELQREDLKKSFDSPDQLVMVIRAPPETQMQVSEPSQGYQVSLKSTRGQIDVFLCPEESSGVSSPVTGTSTSSTVTATSQQDPSSMALGEETESLLGGDPFSSLGDMPDFNLSPLSSSDFLNGDGLPLPLDGFINLSPPHSHDYHFGLEENEGISELFDCDFGDLSQVLGDS